jgi:phage shock protein A
MSEEKIGILSAIFRYFRFWNWKKARGIIQAADEQFTGSVDGISAAFEIQRDKMVKQFTGLRDAISEVESVLEEKRNRLQDLNTEEEGLIKKREGALAMAEKAKEQGDTATYEQHALAFERFQVRIDEIEEMQARLETEVNETGLTMDKYMLQLQDFQAQIEKMPQQKAEAIADYVSAKQIVELNDRLQGLETSMDRGPISAVMEANKRLTAKAKISEKLAKADVRLQDKQYEQAGRQSTSRVTMDSMLAARKAEKEGVKTTQADTKVGDDRPKI